MNDDTLDLLAKLDDDALAPEEHARLLDTLKADPEARRTLVMHYMIGAGTGRLARVKSKRRARPNRLVFPSRRLLRPVLAAAAALLIVAGIWIANRQPSSAATEWRLADTEGRLVVTRDGRTFAAASGTFLQDGDRLAAHDAARATLMLEDTSTGSARFLLSQTALLTVSADKHAPRLRLESGRLEALVEPRTTAQPLTIETLHAELTVLGTRFIALSDSHSTRARVTEGRIRMTRLSDGQSVEIEADHYAVATADLGRLPHGPYTPGMNVEGRVVFRETFERWNPDVWGTAYFDKDLQRLPQSPLDESVGITSETHGHPTSSHALEIHDKGPSGSFATVGAPLRDIRLPDSFVMEFDTFHVRPSDPAYIDIGGVGELLYENPRAVAMRSRFMRNRQWWRARFETRLHQSEDGLWNAEQKQYMNDVKISHRRYTAIRHPESFRRPMFLFFAVHAGHVKIADVVLQEWTPFDAEPTPPNPTIFRESFAQGWRPHVWQTGLFNPTTRKTRVKDVFGHHVFITKDTQDPNRPEALEIKGASDHILLRVDPRLLRFPERFVMEFDVFHRAPSIFSFVDMGKPSETISSETLYRNPRKVRLQDQARRKNAWWTTRMEIEWSQAPDGTRVADVKEYMNGERMLHKIISDIRDQDSFSPPDVILFVLESGHVMLDNIRVYADPAPETTLAQADSQAADGN